MEGKSLQPRLGSDVTPTSLGIFQLSLYDIGLKPGLLVSDVDPTFDVKDIYCVK